MADPAMKCKMLVAGFRAIGPVGFGNRNSLLTTLLMVSTPARYTTFRTLTLDPKTPYGSAKTWGELLGASTSRLGLLNQAKQSPPAP